MIFAVAVSVIAAPLPAVAAPNTGSLVVSIYPTPEEWRIVQIKIENVKKAGQAGTSYTAHTNGSFAFTNLEPGWYVTTAYLSGTFRFGESETRPDTADAVYVSAGGTAFARVTYPPTGHITGTLTTEPMSDPAAHRSWRVTAFVSDRFGRLTEASSQGVSGGAFSLDNVPAGEVYLHVTSNDLSADLEIYDPTWGNGARSWWDAEPVIVTAGATTRDVALTLTPRTPTSVERLGGADRFEMAANVSKAAIPDAEVGAGVPTVFVANGLNFPDALSAGPVAAALGPLLLTLPDRLPLSTRQEIERLEPERIVIVGGSNSVGPSVQAELGPLASVVTRVSGPDRYAVSRDLARFGFPEGSEFAVLATGANFPDALAAGSYAGSMGAPVILLNGPAGVVDAATMSLLHELGVRSVLIVGGPNSVPESMVAQFVADDSIQILRRATGDDRYMAAAAIPAFHEFPDQYFLANGSGFADALAGSWYAARLGAPIRLATRDCIPRDFPGPDYRSVVTVLGGPNSISEQVASDFTIC